MTRAQDDSRIAMEYRCSTWLALSARLDPDGRLPDDQLDPDWTTAIHVIRDRLQSRFVDPLEAIRPLAYAGFLMVAIDSLLIESLQRVREGKRLEEGKSSELVATFLRERPSFKDRFLSDEHRKPLRTCPCIACDFYRSVRSGILHEGETQNGWTIRVYRPQLLEVVGAARILDRDRFHKAVVTEFHAYLKDLEKPAEHDLRANLRNTLDGICSPDDEAWLARGRSATRTDARSRR
jgi:hypothetical protein